MAIDKKINYAIQGGGPNYLGKQKMVTAPKKWKSSPDHETAELAYITKKEKDILLDLNLYGSLKDGKPNRGPSGIISLQGDMGGWSGGSGSSGSSSGGGNGGNGGNGNAREQYIAQQYTRPPAPRPYKDPDPISEVVPGDVTFEPAVKQLLNIGPSLHGGPKFDKKKADLTKLIREQALEKMDYIPDDTTQLDLNKFGEAYEPVKPDLRTQKEKDEDFERSIDWDKVKDLSKKGYDFKEIQDAMNKGLLTKEDPQSMKTGLLDRGIRSIRNIIPKTGLEKSLLSRLTKNVFAPTEGGMFDPKRIGLNLAKNYAMKKLGLGALNPFLGIASLFGFDPFKGLTNKFAKKPVDMSAFSKLGLYDTGPVDSTLTARGPSTTAQKIATGDVDLNKLITGENEFKDIEGQQAKLKGLALGQMRVLQKKQGMEEYGGEKFTPKDQRMLDKLREMDKEEKVYTMPILTAHGGLIDRPLTGRSRDI